MNNFVTRLSCKFIGWNYNLLQECSEASIKTLRRYTDAVILMMFLWAYIGYNMADRYFKFGLAGCIIAAVVFAFLVWIIERQIILIVGKNRMIGIIRGVLAVCMALVGATVTDQLVFGKDINAQMSEVVERRTDEQMAFRKKLIEDELFSYHKELDSLETESARLAEIISKQPVIKSVLYSKTATGQVDSLGKPIMANGYTQENIPNPKIADRERIEERIGTIREGITTCSDKMQNLRNSLLEENKNNIGLLTELEVTFSDKVLFSSWVISVFYGVFFLVFLLIELLVVTGKVCSKPCDYEALVEKQQEKRVTQICDVMQMTQNSK